MLRRLQRLCRPALPFALLGMGGGLLAQPVPYGIASWPEAGHGNHRALVHVSEPANAIWAHIEWRRRDHDPETKDIRVFDAATGERVMNVARVNVTRAYGDLLFQPVTVPGDYEVYYLPYNPGTGNFDDPGTYFAPEDTADPGWLEDNGLTPEGIASGKWRSLPRSELVEIQARNEFHRFDPMEVIATEAEVARLLAQYPNRTYLLFPEDREHAIRMFDDLPYRWVQRGPSNQFRGTPQPGEYYVFQIGVYAARRPIEDVELSFSDLRIGRGQTITSSELTCFNLEGTDWLGCPMSKVFELGQGQVRPLWIGVQVPQDGRGTYRGTITVRPLGAEESTVNVRLRVNGPVLVDCGDSELWRLSRLRWLNSTLGLDDDIVPPFTPLGVEGNTVKCLGREVAFGAVGLPASINSNGREILAAPIHLVVETDEGPVAWAAGETRVPKASGGVVQRETQCEGDGLELGVESQMEFDGCVLFRATLKAKRDVELRDVRLELPLRREVARYMMGMSRRGGLRPKEWDWAWDIGRADNMVWLGDVHAGIQLKLMGPHEVWSYVNLKQSGIPESWGNGGQGGCRIREAGERVDVVAFTGPRRLGADSGLVFHFRLLVTPFKPIDPRHWDWRYGNVQAAGNIAHVHHACPENPYINYPFLTADRLAEYVQAVKSIRTCRTDPGELTYPAEGNINLERGALHIWARVNFYLPAVEAEETQSQQPWFAPLFDSGAPKSSQPPVNQNLFILAFPNEDELCFYWNVDDWGMRAYVRQGAPEHNQFPALLPSHSPNWQEGERHLLTLSWGDELAIFVDGRRLAAMPYRGTLQTSLEGATIRLLGGFAVDAVKITDVPFGEGMLATPSVDEDTLLLDAFGGWNGGEQTRPEKMAGERGCGQVRGVCQKVQGEYGPEIVFSSREVPVAPKGVNLYYTVRELSNHVVEMWPLRSLGDEVFRSDEHYIYSVEKSTMATAGGGYPWLKEHLVAGYVPAWRQPLANGETDAAIATQGLSRWHNYYVEGLKWLMDHTGIDGLYLDGIGYDREIMKRVAKVMVRTNPQSRINFHSGNDYDYDDRRISPANIYMEHLPYLSNLWFGEMFDYNRSPDYWLVEISGIPFGLTSEMLEYGGNDNPYRGMLYGMTGRFNASKEPMWRFWDEVGIQEAEMIGYWEPDCPVRTGRDDILATAYRRRDRTAVSIASWADEAVDVKLRIDWQGLGLDPEKARLYAPSIPGFQPEASSGPSDGIPVEPGKGWLLVISENTYPTA